MTHLKDLRTIGPVRIRAMEQLEGAQQMDGEWTVTLRADLIYNIGKDVCQSSLVLLLDLKICGAFCIQSTAIWRTRRSQRR